MRVIVFGKGESAKALRSLVAQDQTLVLSERYGQFTIKLVEDAAIQHPVLDGVDNELERLILAHIARAVGVVSVEVDLKGGSLSDVITIRVPDAGEAVAYDIERAIYRALLDHAGSRVAPPWWQFWSRG